MGILVCVHVMTQALCAVLCVYHTVVLWAELVKYGIGFFHFWNIFEV